MSTVHTSTNRIRRFEMREGVIAWMVRDYQAVRTLMSDPRFSLAAAAHLDRAGTGYGPVNPELILNMDPPQHTRLRRPLLRQFTPANAERLRDFLDHTAEELLDGFTGPPVDLVEQFAAPLTSIGTCAALDLPPVDHTRLRAWFRPLLALAEEHAAGAAEAAQEFGDYLAALLDHPDVRGHGGMADSLVNSLDPDEASGLIGFLLISGHTFMSVQLTNCVLELLAHPEQWRQLVADPALVGHAVEELLRFAPPEAGQLSPRMALEDLELAGVPIQAGDLVVPSAREANRDPSTFSNPDELDITRERCPHLSFGPGRHHCVGAHLARVELRVALTALVRRFPGLRLATARQELRYRPGLQFQELVALPITW
jgi:cytochrome P450